MGDSGDFNTIYEAWMAAGKKHKFKSAYIKDKANARAIKAFVQARDMLVGSEKGWPKKLTEYLDASVANARTFQLTVHTAAQTNGRRRLNLWPNREGEFIESKVQEPVAQTTPVQQAKSPFMQGEHDSPFAETPNTGIRGPSQQGGSAAQGPPSATSSTGGTSPETLAFIDEQERRLQALRRRRTGLDTGDRFLEQMERELPSPDGRTAGGPHNIMNDIGQLRDLEMGRNADEIALDILGDAREQAAGRIRALPEQQQAGAWAEYAQQIAQAALDLLKRGASADVITPLLQSAAPMLNIGGRLAVEQERIRRPNVQNTAKNLGWAALTGALATAAAGIALGDYKPTTTTETTTKAEDTVPGATKPTTQEEKKPTAEGQPPPDTEHMGKNNTPPGQEQPQENPDNQRANAQGDADAQPNGGMGAAYGQHFGQPNTIRAAQPDTVVGQTTKTTTQASRPGEKDNLKLAAGSDTIIGGPQAQNNALATMRPIYPQPNGSEVVPSVKKQLASDIAFDMFSVVRPGFGLGADNKLFVQQDIWEKKIRGMNPHTFPRGNGGANGGPEGGIKPAPWPLQNVMTGGQVDHLFDRVNKRTSSIAGIVQRTRTRTVNTLPDDIVGSGSAKGLKRKPSPLEPIYNHHEPWLPYNEHAGIFLNRRGFKHAYNPMRTPLRVEHDPLNGMPTLNKRRALEVILQ